MKATTWVVGVLMAIAVSPVSSNDSTSVLPARSQAPSPAYSGVLVAQSPDVMDQTYQAASGTDGQGMRLDSGRAGELTSWDDPTEEEHYQEYPEDEPLPDEMDQSLEAIAADMRPGEWRRLPDAKYMGGGKWTDNAYWDADRQRVSYVGHPGRPRPTRWVMWDLEEGQWYRQVGDQFHPKAGIHHEWGYRSYGKYTQLADGSNVYARFDRLWKQDPETLEWEAWTMHGCYTMISNIEYFPEMNAVVAFGATMAGRDKTKFCAYDLDSGEWFDLPRPQVQGRHSLMRYNPVRGEILLLGGDQSYRTAEILNADGSLTSMGETPRNARIRVDMLSVDPVSGHYLVMITEGDDQRGMGSSDVEFFGFNAEADDWYLIDQWTRAPNHVTNVDPPAWPFTSEYASPVTVPLPEYGVTMWIESTRNGVHLYKHDAGKR